MGIKQKIAQYRAYKEGVMHCTFNPSGPGVVRIHLIPPRFRLFGNSSYIIILNGYYLLPIGYSWALLLRCFIEEVNRFDGKPIGDGEMDGIAERTVIRVHRLYGGVHPSLLHRDLMTILDILFDIADGVECDAELQKLSIRAYAKRMTAPHRMDLMVRAMTDEGGRWQCNQKCLFCYAAGQSYAKVRELSTAEWKTAIDRLRAAGVPMVTFTGGEPTQREDLSELVAHARWFVTRLNTNGVMLTEELASKLKEADLDSVQITLYSSDAEIHNALVGSAHFSDTVSGIENAVRAGLDVSVNTPLCRKNADYLETLRFLHEKGVRFVTVSGLICTGTAGINHAEYDLSKDELTEIVRSARAFCDAHEMEIDFTSPGLIDEAVLESLGMNVPMCGAALSNMAIAPDGTVVPCQSWLGTDAGLGNILADPFRKIWGHKTCRALRKMSREEALSCPFRKSKEQEGDDDGKKKA